MPLSFKTSTVTVGDLLCGPNVFRMPIFQRAYSWDDETALELFNDLDEAMDRAKSKGSGSYFLGPIILSHNSSTAPFEVVDGQQRLVTITIILAILRDLLPLGKLQQELQEAIKRPGQELLGLPESPRIRLREIDQESLEVWVQQPGGTDQLPGEAPTEATDRLLTVIRAIQSGIGKVDDRYVKRLSQFICANCVLLQIVAPNLDDAYVLFRSFNSRGVPLNELDIIRAELVGTTGDYDPQLASQIAQCWDHIQAELGHDELLVYVQTIVGLVAPYAEEMDLRDVLRTVLKVPKTAVQFKAFLTAFLTSYEALDEASLDFGPTSDAINRVVHCLKNLPFDDWRIPVLVWLAMKHSALETYKFLRALEALGLGMMITNATKLQRAKRFRLVKTEVLADTALSHNGNLYMTNAEHTKIRDSLRGPVSARKKFVRHLLLRLNAELLDKNIPPYFPHEATIEHVLPQRPRANSRWTAMFPDSNKRKYCCELLGNYALLTSALNAKARNYEFGVKRRSIFAMSNVNMFPLTGNLVTFETWTERDIIRRQGQMLSLLEGILGVSLGWPATAAAE